MIWFGGQEQACLIHRERQRGRDISRIGLGGRKNKGVHIIYLYLSSSHTHLYFVPQRRIIFRSVFLTLRWQKQEEEGHQKEEVPQFRL
jgi:hypothetical protein